MQNVRRYASCAHSCQHEARGVRLVTRPSPHTRPDTDRSELTSPTAAQLIEEDPAITERILKDQLKLMGLYAAHTVGGSHSPWPRRPSS